MVMSDVEAAIKAMQGFAMAAKRLSRVPSRVAPLAAAKLESTIHDACLNEQDPYGKPWAPHSPLTTKWHGPHAILDLDGHLINGTTCEPQGAAGIRVSLGATYGVYHQLGFLNARTKTEVPARRILPYFGGFPRSWTKALTDAANEAFEEALG
jgi:hypothetical protein